MKNLTELENKILTDILNEYDEDAQHSYFIIGKFGNKKITITKEERGALSSLIKKGVIYCYNVEYNSKGDSDYVKGKQFFPTYEYLNSLTK